MKEIWEEHHRQIKEIDRKHKRNLKLLFAIIGLILYVIVA
jgi:predicted nucleic acid-binding Zn ribbon protein